MAVKIRLTRLGDKKSPFYRVVVADSRAPRDGKFIEVLGTFDPKLTNDADQIKLDVDLAKSWLEKGATPTDTAQAVLVRAGAMDKPVYKAKANAKAAAPKPKKKDAKKAG